jgi:hypothetical protein
MWFQHSGAPQLRNASVAGQKLTRTGLVVDKKLQFPGLMLN